MFNKNNNLDMIKSCTKRIIIIIGIECHNHESYHYFDQVSSDISLGKSNLKQHTFNVSQSVFISSTTLQLNNKINK